MENGIRSKSEKLCLLDSKVAIYKRDLLRAISWLEFVPEPLRDSEDEQARNHIIKIINYLTRNG